MKLGPTVLPLLTYLQLSDRDVALNVFLLIVSFVFQALTVDLHYYYILQLSFYLSLLFSQFTDIRRKVTKTNDSHLVFL